MECNLVKISVNDVMVTLENMRIGISVSIVQNEREIIEYVSYKFNAS